MEIAYFPEATRTMLKGPYDIGLVEGSVTTHQDAQRIQEVRRQCKTLITIGACATAGGIQALRNWKDVDEFVRVVYATPQFISTLKLSTPIAEHVPVDFELRGCPINKHQLIELITATLAGRKPNIPTLQRLHRVQAQGERVHRGGARDCLPGAGNAGGLRRSVPELRPRLLRLLWAHGNSEYRFAHQSISRFWGRLTIRSCARSADSMPGRGSSARPARSVSTNERARQQKRFESTPWPA